MKCVVTFFGEAGAAHVVDVDMSTRPYGLGGVPDGLDLFDDSGVSVQGTGGELVSSWNGPGDVRGRAVEFDDLASGDVGKCHGHVVCGRGEDDGAWLVVVAGR